jgi:cell division protein FtsW
MRVVSRRAAVIDNDGSVHRRHRPDMLLVVISLILLVIGLIVIYSISPGLSVQRHVSENYYVDKQLIAIGLGAITFGVMAFVPVQAWRRLQMPIMITAAVATLIALALPVNELYPAHRWIRFGGLSFQSVELIKFAIIFVFGAFLADRVKKGDIHDVGKTLKPMLIVFVILGVVVAKLQSDFGSAAVMVAMMLAMAYVAGVPLKKIALFGGIVAIGAVLAISSTPYRRDRLLTFMHPERGCETAAGYQACQALIAVGSGGMFGKGLGQSVQAYGYLPEAANDSIFAIYAEKFGFFGVTVLVLLFLGLFTRFKNIMERAPDVYTRLIVAGVLAWFSTQAIINIGAMVGLLPLKGITLPFISYGGTSIIFVTAAVGLVFNISRYTSFAVRDDLEEGKSNDDSAYRRGDRRPHYAYPSRRP